MYYVINEPVKEKRINVCADTARSSIYIYIYTFDLRIFLPLLKHALSNGKCKKITESTAMFAFVFGNTIRVSQLTDTFILLQKKFYLTINFIFNVRVNNILFFIY